MTKALIIVDVQNDFVEGGSLAVTGGRKVAENLAQFIKTNHSDYDAIFITQDWHVDPGTHWAPEGTTPDFNETWPKHCEAATHGAEIVDTLAQALGELVINKNVNVIRIVKGEYKAAYSGFEGHEFHDNDYATLELALIGEGTTELDIAGIATDHCVKATVLDAIEANFTVKVLTQFTAGVAEEPTKKAFALMTEKGATLV